MLLPKVGGCVRREQNWGSLGQEQTFHINYLELKAVFLGLQSLCGNTTHKHIRILSDKATTVAYINAMGGIKSQVCNDMAHLIWGGQRGISG